MEVRDRILIIEDDRSIRKFFRTILEANRYDVISADTGEEGYSLITSQCPDLVILDLGLPDIDGMEILSRLRKWSGMPVVVISARSHEKDKVEALRSRSGRLYHEAVWNIGNAGENPGSDPSFENWLSGPGRWNDGRF